MARKRAREESAEDQHFEPGAVNVAEVQAAALAGEQRRQATARDVARRQAHWLCCPVSCLIKVQQIISLPTAGGLHTLPTSTQRTTPLVQSTYMQAAQRWC